MKIEKWKDLSIEPTKIKFKEIKDLEIISYPYAQNDVVECKCKYNDKIINVFIKIERSRMADFTSEINNLNTILNNNYYYKIPKVIENGVVDGKEYMVLEKIDGDRLSIIFDKNNFSNRKEYLINYGKELGTIHKIPIKLFNISKKRIINDLPTKDDYKEFDDFIKPYIDYLDNHKIDFNNDTFIHGDFHYANILWNNTDISGVLDFEYSGKGLKEQDIAWSIILRPSQKFMDNINDIKYFLKGYSSVNNYDIKKLKWCLINGYCHFYLMNKDNHEYIDKLKKLIKQIYNSSIL